MNHLSPAICSQREQRLVGPETTISADCLRVTPQSAISDCCGKACSTWRPRLERVERVGKTVVWRLMAVVSVELRAGARSSARHVANLTKDGAHAPLFGAACRMD
jgi:hypothetical protein